MARLHHFAGYFGGGTALHPPADEAWDEAADLLRALFILKGHLIDQEELRRASGVEHRRNRGERASSVDGSRVASAKLTFWRLVGCSRLSGL